MPQRCTWAESSPLMRAYHDQEWGVPVRDSRALWGKLMLDGFQAGLSWSTILNKRANFYEAFADFDPERIARFGPADVAHLLENSGIVRSRAKINAAIGNARAYLAMQAAGEDFSNFVWKLAGGRTVVNKSGIVPTKTPVSEAISAALKRRGFAFVGPTIVYAWMQAVGMVNDHAADCFRRGQ